MRARWLSIPQRRRRPSGCQIRIWRSSFESNRWINRRMGRRPLALRDWRSLNGGMAMLKARLAANLIGLVLIVLTAGRTIAFAQSTGTIAGTVKDATGAVLPGATVEVSSPALIEKV